MFKFYKEGDTIDIGSNPLTTQKFYVETELPVNKFTVNPNYNGAFFVSQDNKGIYVGLSITPGNINSIPLNQDLDIGIYHDGTLVGHVKTSLEYVNGCITNDQDTIPNRNYIGNIKLWKLKLVDGSSFINISTSGNPTVVAYTANGANTISGSSLAGNALTCNIPTEINGSPVKQVSLTLPFVGGMRENCTYYIQPDAYNVTILPNGD